MLMEFSPAPEGIKIWLECLFWFTGFIAALLFIFKQIKGKPAAPPNEQLQIVHEQLVNRVSSLEAWRNSLIEKLDEDKTEILAAGTKRAGDIYNHIDSVRRELADKCDQIPAMVITILKNTSAKF